MPRLWKKKFKPIELDQQGYTLWSDDSSSDDSNYGTSYRAKLSSSPGLKIWIYILAITNIFTALGLVSALWKIHKQSSPLPPWPATVYSPAQHVVQYEKVVFNDGFNQNDSIFIGPPTDESDRAWEDLWEPPLFAEIGDAQAKRLPNKTIPLPYTSRHLVGLDVFHQLHCLNTLRKRLRPERYDGKGDSGKTKDVATGMKHWDHCVESLRQSLLCSADLSAVSWHWSKEQGWRTGTNEHVCRKWENVMMWAEKHRRRHNQDGSLID